MSQFGIKAVSKNGRFATVIRRRDPRPSGVQSEAERAEAERRETLELMAAPTKPWAHTGKLRKVVR